ncbi:MULTISPECIES: MFS transporter [unclassified Streptomyces]|uniref:MFS transporter n=1 Tax=unclassified Streptomyces TaxID=2593676 RepID=UPI00278C4B02|nr:MULTISPECIES: MFS transporter [unclassified Streptomyces]
MSPVQTASSDEAALSEANNSDHADATAGPDPDPPPPGRDRAWTLAIASIAVFMLMLDLTVVNVALPQLRTELSADFSELQWVMDAYALTLAVFLLTSGSLADRLGRKRIFQWGFAVFTLASLGCGLAQDVLALNIARGVQGAGAAVLFAVGPAMIGHAYRGRDRGMAFGVFGGVTGLAVAFGPLIGGALTSAFSWRWIFLVNVPIGVAALLLGAWRLRESRDPRPYGIDWPGFATFSAALTLIILAFLRGESDGWTSPRIIGMFVLGVVLLEVFSLLERRRGDAAMLDMSLLRISTFNGTSIAAFIANATVLSAIFLQGSYMQNVLGHSPWSTGVRFLPLTLTLFLAAAVTGFLTTSVPPRLLVGLSLTFISAGLFLVTRVDAGSDWTALLPSMVVSGIGMGMFNPPRASLSIGVAEPAKAGMASGIGETFQQVGVAVGIAAFGALFQSRVTASFTDSPLGHRLGSHAEEAGHAAASGATAELAHALPPGQAGQAAAAVRAAFVDGLDDVLLASGTLAAIGAVIGFLCIRSRDLHVSARGERTGEEAPNGEGATGEGPADTSHRAPNAPAS